MWPLYGQVLNRNLVSEIRRSCKTIIPACHVSAVQHSVDAVSFLAAVLSNDDVTCSFVVFTAALELRFHFPVMFACVSVTH